METKEALELLNVLREDLELELDMETKFLNILLETEDKEIRAKIVEILGDISSHSTQLIKKSNEIQKKFL